jgi:hypothetical protein
VNAVLRKIWILIATVLLAACGHPAVAADALLPRVRVDSVRRVFHNGEHNAFTDLVRFHGKLYLPPILDQCPGWHRPTR